MSAAQFRYWPAFCDPIVQWPRTPPFHGGNTGSNPVRVVSPCIGENDEADNTLWRFSTQHTVDQSIDRIRIEPLLRDDDGDSEGIIRFGVGRNIAKLTWQIGVICDWSICH
jgi:hypothetical protein